MAPDGDSALIPTLFTRRLVLRPLELSDAVAAQALFPHWEIVRYLASPPIPWPYPPDGALAWYRDICIPRMQRGEEWSWSIRLRERPQEMIGAISLHAIETNNRGFWLGLPWQGQGLITEACIAVNDFWFGVLNREVLRTRRAVENLASRRVAEKTGMRLIGSDMKTFVCGPMRSEIWELTRAEWQAWRRDT